MSFSGAEVTRKGFPQGWGRSLPDQEQQRTLRVTQLLESYVLHSWSWNRFQSSGLRYAYHGGVVDSGSAWVVVNGGSVMLADNDVNYVQRSATGTVSVSQSGFSYGLIPMAQVTTLNGRISLRGYIDRRPFASEAGTGSGPGAITFNQILGQILDDQMTESAVTQFESALSIAFTQLTGIATRAQLPAEIAYEDEVNCFTDQQRRGIRTITVSDSPYLWVDSDWHLNVNPDGGQTVVLVPDAAAHFDGTQDCTDQLHFKHIGLVRNPVVLRPAVSGQLIDRCPEAIMRQPGRSFTLVSDGSDWWIQ